MASENRYYSIDFSGKLVTVCEPMILKPGDFTVVQNVRYVPNGYGGTTLRGVAGITKVNAAAPSTYTNFKSGIHFRKDQPSETHLLVQALDSGGTAGRILDNTTAITGSETGAFSSTALYTLTNTGTGRFNLLPDQSVGFANGYDCVVWGGDEYRIGKIMNVDYTSDTFQYDGTDLVINNLTTEYMSIKSVATEVAGSATAKILLHGNATPVVNSGASTATMTVTGAAYSTAQKKFGPGSIVFDGTNDKIEFAASTDFQLDGGAVTVDFWAYITSIANDGCMVAIVSTSTPSENYIRIGLNSSIIVGITHLQVSMIIGGAQKIGTNGLIINSAPYLNTWTHICFTENGDNAYLFINGELKATNTITGSARMPAATATVNIGVDQTAAAAYLTGYLDELAFWKSAKYTSTFTPPEIEYAASTYSTFASVYIASPRALSGVKLYVGTANDATSELNDVKEWDGTSWKSCTTQSDGTANGGISLAQTGTITWDSTVTTSKPRILYNTHAYWYLLQFAGLNNTTLPTVYYVTVKAPFQAFTDMFDGVLKKPSMVWREMAADEFKDKTTEVQEVDWAKFENKVTSMKLNSFNTTDAFYVGSPFRLQGVNIVFANEDDSNKYENSNVSALTVSYWDGDSWVAVSGLIDGTRGGDSDNVTFHHGGMVTWTPPAITSEYKREISNSFPFYYYKFTVSAQFDSQVGVDQIQVIPASKDLKPSKFCFPWQNRTVLINEYSGYQDKIQASIPYSTTTFNGDNAFETRVDDALVAGTSIHTRYDNSNLEDALLCSKTKTYLLTGSGSKDFKVAKISDVYGCINPNSMRTCTLTSETGKREVVVWLSQVGPVMYDGARIQRVDDDIRDKWTPNHANAITYSTLLTMYADFDERHNEYWLMTASSTAWVYNVEYNKWWYFNQAPASGNLQGCFPVYSADGHQYMFTFSSAGFLLRMNNGNSRDTGTIVRTITLSDFALLKQADMLFKKTDINFISLYLSTDSSADSATLSHYGDGSTTPTTLATFTQSNSGYSYKELRTNTSNVLATSHILHKLSLSQTADDTAIGLEPLLMTIRYREAQFKDT